MLSLVLTNPLPPYVADVLTVCLGSETEISRKFTHQPRFSNSLESPKELLGLVGFDANTRVLHRADNDDLGVV